MKSKSKSKTKRKRKAYRFAEKYTALAVMLVLAVVFAAGSLVQLQVQLSDKKAELQNKTEQYNSIKDNADELQKIVDSGNTDAYAVRVAREELGYAFPDEQVYKVSD